MFTNVDHTSGSVVLLLVWINILPIVTSLHTDTRASSNASPARNIDTPQILRIKSRFQYMTLKCNAPEILRVLIRFVLIKKKNLINEDDEQ